MWLRTTTDFIERVLSPLVSAAGKVGAGFIAIMMFLTVTDVVGRRFFNHPVPGSYELSEFMLVIVVFFSIAVCQLFKGHITIDLLVARFRSRTQDIIDSIMYVFFLMMSFVLSWQLFVYAIKETGGDVSGILNVPVAPFLYLAALGSAFLTLVVLMHFLLFIAGALKK